MAAKVSNEIFRAVKIMTAGGAKLDEMARCLNVSVATISRIKASETLDDYLNKQKDYQKKLRYKQTEDKSQDPEIQNDSKDQKQYDMVSNYQIGRMIELLKAQNELLTHISNKLAFVVEQLV